jgi:hypothetical protein
MTESLMKGEQLVWWELEGETEERPSATSSNTNPTRSDLGLNPERRDGNTEIVKATAWFHTEITIHISE